MSIQANQLPRVTTVPATADVILIDPSTNDGSVINAGLIGGGSSTVDTALSPTSTNPVQNRAIYAGLASTHRLLGVTEITTETDYNALLTTGEYYVLAANTSKLTNSPVTAAHRITVELLLAGERYVRQTVRPYNDERVYTRRTQNGGSSWSAWSKFVGTVATTSADGLMSSTDKGRLDTLYDDYSSALTALG